MSHIKISIVNWNLVRRIKCLVTTRDSLSTRVNVHVLVFNPRQFFACSLRDQYVFTIGQTQYIKGDPLTLHLITSNEAQCI